MTPVFVCTNKKGGVGKTTTAVNLAYGLIQVLRGAKARNCKVLIVDTDSQANATLLTTAITDGEGGEAFRTFGPDESLYAALMADRKDVAAEMSRVIIQSTWDEDLHVLPGGEDLDRAERELIGVPGNVYRLQLGLSLIARNYAAVVIDTRPSFTLLTEMALVAATDAIIPMEPRFLESVGLQAVIDKIAEIREGWQHPNLRIAGIVVTKYNKQISGHRDMVNGLQSHPGLGKLLLGMIPANEAITYAHSVYRPIWLYDGSCAAAHAYADLVQKMAQSMFVTREA